MTAPLTELHPGHELWELASSLEGLERLEDLDSIVGLVMETCLGSAGAARGWLLLEPLSPEEGPARFFRGEPSDQPPREWGVVEGVYRENRTCLGQHSVAVPLYGCGERVGVLYLEGRDPSPVVAPLERVAEVAGTVLGEALLRRRDKRRQLDLESARSLHQALTLQNQELQRINGELHDFAVIAAHELQEPMRALRGYARLLRERLPANADVDSYLERIMEAASRMSSLTSDILRYAESSNVAIPRQRLNPAELLAQAREDLAEELRDSGARVERDVLPWVEGDPIALRMVYKNLLSNAIKFRRGSRPIIQVGAREGDAEILFWVRDDGIGIPREFCEEVFLPFRRLHTLEEYPGSGMGLTVARRLLERHGGRIWIEPRPEGGVTVFFTLASGGARA
ncbi:MAG: hypothetical protein HY319_14230 [Armatimonadetes bacterium]|nr:hypothetical protein [Armatimonadota bacterium]